MNLPWPELFLQALGKVGTVLAEFSSNFNANMITLFSVGSIKVDYCDFTNSLRQGFKPYTNACMVSSLPSLGNATTILSKAAVYSYTEPHCHSSHNLSLTIFFSSSGMY